MENNMLLEAFEKFQSPTYVFDMDIVRARIALMREKLSKEIKLCYAMKANPFLVGAIEPIVDRLEVCSPGEYEICIDNHIPYDKIVVSGVNKTRESMHRILTVSEGRGIYTIESVNHFEILDELSRELGYNLKVDIRLSSGNQFGVDKDTFLDLCKRVTDSERLSLCGVHYYSGTQKKMSKINKEMTALSGIYEEVLKLTGNEELELEYGPGLIESYFAEDSAPDPADQLMELSEALGTVPYKHIALEFGRFITSLCGYFITQVNDVKNTDGHIYCIVDGGIHQINYFGQMMGMKHPYIETFMRDRMAREEAVVNICGSLCTVNDVITREIAMPMPHKGDVIAFLRCGAYSVTECMAMFLSRELPKVVIYSEEEGFKLLRDTILTAQFNH